MRRSLYALLFLLYSISGHAQEASPTDPTPTLTNLDQRQRILERKWEVAEEVAAEKAKAERDMAAKAPEVSGAAGKGITVRLGDAYSLNLRSRFQLRYQLNAAAADSKGERDLQQVVNLGTARLWLSGHALKPTLTYMFQFALAGRDYRDGAISPIFDAYVDWAAHRDLRVRVGQYFVPFDRLRTVREFALQMADRPRPVGELTLDRDVGVTLYSDNFLGDESPIAWRIGVFGGGGTNLTTGHKPGALVVGRLEWRPLGPIDDDSEGDLERRSRPAVAVGIGAARNFNSNRLRSTTGAIFATGTTDYDHLAADLTCKWAGFALQAEYLRKTASDAPLQATKDGKTVTEYPRAAHGWVTQASYLFEPPIEVVGRLAGLYPLDHARMDPKFVKELDAKGQEVGLGLNWYLNGHRLKVQADWIALMPHDFAFAKAEHVGHLQLDATF